MRCFANYCQAPRLWHTLDRENFSCHTTTLPSRGINSPLYLVQQWNCVVKTVLFLWLGSSPTPASDQRVHWKWKFNWTSLLRTHLHLHHCQSVHLTKQRRNIHSLTDDICVEALERLGYYQAREFRHEIHPGGETLIPEQHMQISNSTSFT